MAVQKIGTCKSCGENIYRSENTGIYIGHKPHCRNVRTNNLDK